MSCLGQKATVDLDMDGYRIVNLGNPVNPGDASFIVYDESITAPDANTRTFAFTVPITAVRVAYIGGIAQRPADFSVVNGSLVFSDNVAAPDPALSQFVTALYS